jgi:GH25 family lysozyme M1 (1,4-beta-N-acetylmuramidase)
MGENQADCPHSFPDWTVDIAPTCSTEGKRSRVCADCGFVSVEYLAVLPHTLNVVETVEPTCLTEGYSVYLCECGYTYKANYKTPLGHNLIKTNTVAKTCSEVGYTHYACDNCEYAFDSDFVPQSHSFETSVTRPTATQTGFTTHTCKDCAYYYDSDFLKYTDILPSPYLDDSTPLCKGIDIANIEHNTKPDGSYEPIDWESLKAQGYDFVILKVGSNYSGKSNTFEMDYAGAKAAGLGVGAYYYAYSSTVSGTRKDAQEVLEWIEGKQFEYPIYYDIEESYLAESLSKDSLTELITTFIEELQANGYYSALYVNANWLNNILDTETIVSRFDIWYARFVPEESPTWDESFGKQLSMWQYTDKGIAEGIRDYIDINYCYRDYPTLMKKWGLNGFEKEIEETKETAKAEEVSEEK